MGARSGLGSSDPKTLPSPLVTNLPVSQRYIKAFVLEGVCAKPGLYSAHVVGSGWSTHRFTERLEIKGREALYSHSLWTKSSGLCVVAEF